MPPKNKPGRPSKKNQDNDCELLSVEEIKTIVEEQMREEFEQKFSQLKDSLINLMAEKLSSLIEENHTLRTTLDKEIGDLLEWQKEINVEMQEITSKQTSKTCNLKRDIKQVQEQLNSFQTAFDGSEQLLKEKNLRVIGISEDEDETYHLKDHVVDVSSNLLKIPNITTDDIDEAYQLGKPKEGETRSILVRLKTKTA